MTGISSVWQRHPASFALILAALMIVGFLVMLSDAALIKVIGFAISSLPLLIATRGYRRHRRLSLRSKYNRNN
ncbi:hypothetical protein ACLBXO_30790 [Methylobacterium sp. C33D]